MKKEGYENLALTRHVERNLLVKFFFQMEEEHLAQREIKITKKVLLSSREGRKLWRCMIWNFREMIFLSSSLCRLFTHT